MADGGIIQMVELQLDAATAAAVRDAISNALNEGTKADKPVQNLKKVEGGLNGLRDAAKEVQKVISELGLALGFTEIIKKVVEANAEYEKITVQLSAFTGSIDSAKDAVEALEEIQRSVPVTLRDLSAAYVTLRNVGIDPSASQMTHFANIAAATGKTVEEVSNTIAMATLGRVRGFTQLGIQAVADGDKLKLTFRGVTTEITNNAASIVKYMDDIGKNKFGDAATAQANTLGGAWTMLKSALDRLFEAIGEHGVAGALVDLIQQWTKFADELSKDKPFLDGTATALEQIGTGALRFARVTKEIVLDVVDLLAGAFLTVKGNIELANGALKALMGNMPGAVATIKQGLDDIAHAGAHVESIGGRFNAGTDQINADRQHKLVSEARAGDDRDSLGNMSHDGTGQLGNGKAPTNIISKETADAAQKVLDVQMQLFAQLAAEADERQKILGITNIQLGYESDRIEKGKEIIEHIAGEYEKRLQLVAQERSDVQGKIDTLTKQLQDTKLSDEARKLMVAKLQTLVNQGKALSGEYDRLLAAFRQTQRLVAGNSNAVPGAGGGLNAGVDAANNGGAGIMGMHGGMTPDQWSAVGGIVSDDTQTRIDKMTQSIHKWGDAWFSAFAAIGAGKNAFKELEKAAGATLSLLAQKYAEMEIAQAAKDFAEGGWPPNPAAIAAGFKHLAAAALFNVVGGLASTLGSGGDSGSGGAASSNVGGSQTQNAKAMQPIVHVTTYAFDPKSPVHQNYLGTAIEAYVERAGGRVVFGGTR